MRNKDARLRGNNQSTHTLLTQKEILKLAIAEEKAFDSNNQSDVVRQALLVSAVGVSFSNVFTSQIDLDMETPKQITALDVEGYVKLRTAVGTTAYVGGADVTTETGFLLDDNNNSDTFNYSDLSNLYVVGSGVVFVIGGTK